MDNAPKITRDQFFNFIRTKRDTSEKLSSSTQHYLEHFDSVQQGFSKWGWNWSAFFFTPWFFYRRMYANGFMILLVQIGCSFVLNFFSFLPTFFMLIGHIFIQAIPAIYANSLYLDDVEEKISQGATKVKTSIPSAILSLLFLTKIGWVTMFFCFTQLSLLK